jgi:hypothetical protein
MPFWYIFEGIGMEKFGVFHNSFYGRFGIFLWPFWYIFMAVLVYFYGRFGIFLWPFWYI